MNDFKIVKCPKCDAGLVEFKGEKLSRCVQCQHKFFVGPQTKKGSTAISGNISKSKGLLDLIKKLNQIKDTKVAEKSEPKNLGNQTENTPKNISIKKKKSNPIGSIMFYVFLFIVLRQVFKF